MLAGFFVFQEAGFDGANMLPMPGGAANNGGEEIAGDALNIGVGAIADAENNGGEEIG